MKLIVMTLSIKFTFKYEESNKLTNLYSNKQNQAQHEFKINEWMINKINAWCTQKNLYACVSQSIQELNVGDIWW